MAATCDGAGALVIRVRGVSFSYEDRQPVLDDLTVDLPTGLTLLLGPNGSGKSTFLRIVAGVEMPDAGSIEIGGADLWREEVRARRALAYVPEHPDLTPYATLAEILTLVCRLRGEPAQRAQEVLRVVGLGALGGRSVRELSMGQRRRALLAAAVIGTPRILLLDEPLESLDLSMREWTLAWIDAALERGATVVVATHDIEPFVDRSARAMSLSAGLASLRDPLPVERGERLALLESLDRARTPPYPDAPSERR